MGFLVDLLRRFFRELLLQSGQFALFYLLIQFSTVGLGVFGDFGHTMLLIILAAQTVILAQWGDRPAVRFAGSLIAPLCYTFLESLDGGEFLLNAAHAGFWIFSLTTGGLQALSLRARKTGWKVVLEFLLTFLNVAIFLVLYFYFDTQQTVAAVKTGSVALELTLGRIFTHLPQFLADPPHLYVLWGGLLLAFSLALGRTHVLRLKERINTVFGQYVDRDLRDEILSGEGLQPRQTDLAVLFSDLRNFTGASENADPGAVTRMLNLYFSRWTEVVRRHGGIVDKFIGDAVMVHFGLKDPEKACQAAVDCGLEMVGLWPQLRAQFAAQGLPVPDGLGIGIHFGPVVLGDIGSEDRKNVTIIGDTVNTASRLESTCKAAGQVFLVSSEVRDRLEPATAALTLPLGPLALKGKDRAVEVWAIVSRTPGD
jgi:class 3 adenylate cyclase